MAIIEHQFTYPDGKGGYDVHHFETSANMVVSDGKKSVQDELNRLKSDLNSLDESTFSRVDFSIAAEDWHEDEWNGTPYRYYADIEVEDLIEDNLVMVNLPPSSYGVVTAAGVCGTGEVWDGRIRLYAANKATGSMSGECVIFKGGF